MTDETAGKQMEFLILNSHPDSDRLEVYGRGEDDDLVVEAGNEGLCRSTT